MLVSLNGICVFELGIGAASVFDLGNDVGGGVLNIIEGGGGGTWPCCRCIYIYYLTWKIIRAGVGEGWLGSGMAFSLQVGLFMYFLEIE